MKPAVYLNPSSSSSFPLVELKEEKLFLSPQQPASDDHPTFFNTTTTTTSQDQRKPAEESKPYDHKASYP